MILKILFSLIIKHVQIVIALSDQISTNNYVDQGVPGVLIYLYRNTINTQSNFKMTPKNIYSRRMTIPAKSHKSTLLTNTSKY